MILGLNPKIVDTKYQSGAENLTRPLSSGKQEYEIDSTTRPPLYEPKPKLDAILQCSGTDWQYLRQAHSSIIPRMLSISMCTDNFVENKYLIVTISVHFSKNDKYELVIKYTICFTKSRARSLTNICLTVSIFSRAVHKKYIHMELLE